MSEQSAPHSLQPTPPSRMLVLVSSRYDDRYLVEHAARLCQDQAGGFVVLWIDTGRVRDTASMAQLERTFALAHQFGGETLVLQGPSAIRVVNDYIAVHQPRTVVLGSPVGRHWPWRRPLSQQLLQSQLPLEISVHTRPDTSMFAPPPATHLWLGMRTGYIAGILAMALAGLIGVTLHQILENGSLVVLYVLTVALIGLSYGTRPAIFTALLSYFAFNFLHTEPLFSLDVHKGTDLRTLIFMVVTGLICGPVASRARQQFELLKAANRAAEMQRDFANELSSLDNEHAVWTLTAQRFQSLLQRPVYILKANQQWVDDVAAPLQTGAMQHLQHLWTHDQPYPFEQWWAQPIYFNQQTHALLLVPQQGNLLRPEQREQLRQLSQQLVLVLQRIVYSAQAESSRIRAEMEQLRSALLASVSHDLRSPLAAMMGSAESLLVLEQQLSTDNKRELLSTILSESQRLDRYIQNLLDMTRLGHGGLKLERDWVPLGDILGSVLARVRKYFPELALDVQIPPHPPMLFVHGALIEQALFNILENAARYNPPDGTVSIEVTQDEQQIHLAIEDQGTGIAKDKREQVFDMFYVVADGDHKRHNTGMGLAICRGMINAHGGSVHIVDALHGHGARVVVSLPLPDAFSKGAV